MFVVWVYWNGVFLDLLQLDNFFYYFVYVCIFCKMVIFVEIVVLFFLYILEVEKVDVLAKLFNYSWEVIICLGIIGIGVEVKFVVGVVYVCQNCCCIFCCVYNMGQAKDGKGWVIRMYGQKNVCFSCCWCNGVQEVNQVLLVFLWFNILIQGDFMVQGCEIIVFICVWEFGNEGIDQFFFFGSFYLFEVVFGLLQLFVVVMLYCFRLFQQEEVECGKCSGIVVQGMGIICYFVM